MSSLNYPLCVCIVTIFSVLYLVFDKWVIRFFKIKTDSVSYESSKIAIDRLATWTTWLTGLQTASIASMGFLFNDNKGNLELTPYGFFALLFFGASIILATWLLSSLPSIQQRLINSKDPEPQNDIYMMRIFSFVPLRMGRFTGLIHTYFLIGMVFFALFVFKIFSH